MSVVITNSNYWPPQVFVYKTRLGGFSLTRVPCILGLDSPGLRRHIPTHMQASTSNKPVGKRGGMLSCGDFDTLYLLGSVDSFPI